jgi:O-acetyl-ADP-ribose deacetylase (regulator of RNase III)
MPMKIVRNDITQMTVDAIVNAANTKLKMGGGVCGAIFSAAGASKLQEECDSIGNCQVGEVVITSGYNLPAKYVIHAVGPIWSGGSNKEAELLHSCYKNSLSLALKNKCQSIAFPLIASGIYGYPKDEALHIAITAISEFLMSNDMMVYLVVYDKKSFTLGEKLFSAIEKYIDDNYVDEHSHYDRRRDIEASQIRLYNNVIEESYMFNESCTPIISEKKRSLEDLVNELEETFSEMLLRLIDEKGRTDVETYKRANIDRKLFSKIRSNKNYSPSKATAIAFAISLELNLDETRDLLGKAGYSLSHSNKFDVIIEYFIIEGNYNVYDINQALFAFNQAHLGA